VNIDLTVSIWRAATGAAYSEHGHLFCSETIPECEKELQWTPGTAISSVDNFCQIL
jgi:hypothetical protein